ncbi:DUF3592 domain-containing protein [Yoonia sp. SS1-5]|uniref:DUF3592 domain-containing protein n=1 Tax=Yoonia rhodophyticola TaxID=3137370 RepID=A0AAN0MBX0_9RHOB
MKFKEYRMLIVAAVLVIAGIWISISAAQQLNIARQLDRVGEEIQATVTSQRKLQTNSGQTDHFITYTFTFDEALQTYERRVPAVLYRVVEPGSNMILQVNPSNPDIHALYAGELSGRPRQTFNAGIVIFVLGAGIFLINGGAILRERRRRNA